MYYTSTKFAQLIKVGFCLKFTRFCPISWNATGNCNSCTGCYSNVILLWKQSVAKDSSCTYTYGLNVRLDCVGINFGVTTASKLMNEYRCSFNAVKVI